MTPSIDPPTPADHRAFLEERIFQIHTRWPHYRRLLDDLTEIAATLGPTSEVLCLERAFVFGGVSLFAPLFDARARFVAYDVRLSGLEEERMGYQRDWTEDARCAARPVDAAGPVSALPYAMERFDQVIVPNVVHHVREQRAMFAEIARVMKPGGRGFVFETLLRELHQIPHDFVRYTPWGFASMLEEAGLELVEWRPAGGPFEAILYCWDQALQYLPEEERERRRRWIEQDHFQELMALEARCPDNRARAHTCFPIAYGLHFRKAS